MSIRSVASRLIQYGQNFRSLLNKSNTFFRPKQLSNLSESISQGQERIAHLRLGSYRLQYDSFFRRCFIYQVSNSFAAQLRRKAASSLMYGGQSAFPLFAFIGLSLVAGEKQKSPQDKIEEICDFIKNSMQTLPWKDKPKFDDRGKAVSDYEFGEVIAKGCNAVVYSARLSSAFTPDDATDNKMTSVEDSPYNIAIKMMFNYEAESNSEAILRSMARETVPAQFEDRIRIRGTVRKKHLPSHLNIVQMSHAFVDYVPNLGDAIALYPDALPVRLNASGLGRNMTLFLVMKRYQSTLREYLHSHKLSCRSALLLFTQLLEGIVHLNHHEIAHRDIKSDNILLSYADNDECPLLVISDFGCCLADPLLGMTLPYFIDEIDKGGNGALMAPEVAGAVPGPRAFINYSKADLWASGAIAYEIFGGKNPFYDVSDKGVILQDLPPLPGKVPPVLCNLIHSILTLDSRQRPPAEIVATACHLLLWGPIWWLYIEPSDKQVVEWLVNMAVKIICQTNLTVEHHLLAILLSRVSLKQILAALALIHKYK